MIKKILLISFLHCTLLYFVPLLAQEPPKTRILFLLDASGSMLNRFGSSSQTRMALAKSTLNEILDSIAHKKNVYTALRVYGHQSAATKRDCQDTQLEAGFTSTSIGFIKDILKTIKPRGVTPIAYSLQKSAGDFPAYAGRNIIILMTDGEESCGGDPCAVAMDLQRKGIVLKHFVIGIDLTPDAEKTLSCFDSYFSAKDPVQLKKSLSLIITKVVNETTLQVNLLDNQKKPAETDVNMTFYDAYTNVAKENYYHTLNHKGLPDTMYFDPLLNYDITFHTIPPIRKNKIELQPDEHNIISAPAPQGELEVLMLGKTINNLLNTKIKCLVTAKNGLQTIHLQDFNTTVKYLTGKYDLEFLTLPRINFKNVDIAQNETTTLKIPAPGIVTFLKKFDVYGGIFIMKNNQLEKIYDLRADDQAETVALQPGSYKVIYKPKYSKTMHSTQEKDFEIISGTSNSVTL